MSKRRNVKLYKHQKDALKRVLKEPFFALFMEQGTGKTLVGIRKIEWYFKELGYYKAIVYMPRALIYNWRLEFQDFTTLNRKEYVIHGLDEKDKKKRLQAYDFFLSNDASQLTVKELKELGYTGNKSDMVNDYGEKLMILLANYEKAIYMFDEIRKYKPHHLVVDESHKLKNPTAKISNKIYQSTRMCKTTTIMTGTPICNGYEDIYMQLKIMDNEIWKDMGITNYKGFRERYLKMGGYMGKEIVGYNNFEELKQIVKDFSYRVLLDDCVELPQMLPEQFLTCELGSKSRKIYNELKNEMVADLSDVMESISRKKLKSICKKFGIPYEHNESYLSLLLKAKEFTHNSSCDLAITKLLRLQQITGGFITNDDGEIINIGKEKLNLVLDYVNGKNEPIIIFCRFIEEMKMIHKELNKTKIIEIDQTGRKIKRKSRVGLYHGKSKNKDQIYQDFRNGNIDYLVIQIKTGSVGLNLQNSSKILIYSWDYSHDTIVQMIGRIKRVGQKNKMQITWLVAEDTHDIEVIKAVKIKSNLAYKLLDE